MLRSHVAIHNRYLRVHRNCDCGDRCGSVLQEVSSTRHDQHTKRKYFPRFVAILHIKTIDGPTFYLEQKHFNEIWLEFNAFYNLHITHIIYFISMVTKI